MKPDLNCENNLCVDAHAWQKKAKAFAIRANKHLWCKNNEDPLSFLYLKGLNLKFISKMSLGWNKFGQNRPCEGWGLSGKGSFFIPPGIVFPYIVEKEVRGIFIISMETPDSDPSSGPSFELIIPGSFKGPLVLGPGNRETRETTGIMEGLRMYQEDTDLITVNISIQKHGLL